MNEPSSAPACYSHKYHVKLENGSVKLKFNFEVKCSLQFEVQNFSLSQLIRTLM